MDKKKLDSVGIDYVNAINRFAGNEMLYEKYLGRFCEQATELLDAALAEMEEKRYGEVLKQIHTMKGIVGTLGMTALFDACSAVVSAIRSDDTSNIEELMNQVKMEYDKVAAIF